MSLSWLRSVLQSEPPFCSFTLNSGCFLGFHRQACWERTLWENHSLHLPRGNTDALALSLINKTPSEAGLTFASRLVYLTAYQPPYCSSHFSLHLHPSLPLSFPTQYLPPPFSRNPLLSSPPTSPPTHARARARAPHRHANLCTCLGPHSIFSLLSSPLHSSPLCETHISGDTSQGCTEQDFSRLSGTNKQKSCCPRQTL